MARRNSLAQKALRRSERAVTAERRLAIQKTQENAHRRQQKALILAKELESRRKFERENPVDTSTQGANECSSDSTEPRELEKIPSPGDSSSNMASSSESSPTPSEPSFTT